MATVAVPLFTGLALTLAMVLVAPAPPASAEVYGRYQVRVHATNDCMTDFGEAGAWVYEDYCKGDWNVDWQYWLFNRVDTYWGDPVFEIRTTYLRTDECLDVPYGNVYAGQPLWTWPCNGGNAQRWRQMPTGTTDSGGNRLYRYVSMSAPDSGWVMQLNNGVTEPYLVMVPASWSPYQMFYQRYIGP